MRDRRARGRAHQRASPSAHRLRSPPPRVPSKKEAEDLSLYVAIQTLLDRSDPPTREELDDAAVWATQELGGEWLPIVRDRAPIDALEQIREAILAPLTVHERTLKASPTTAAIERARNATRLHLEDCTIGARAIDTLANTSFPNLKILELESCRLKPHQIAAICRSEGLDAIERLSFRGNVLRDQGIDVIAKATAFPALRSLSLRYTRATSKSIAALATNHRMQTLRSLELGTDKLGPGLGAALANGFPSLQRLSIYKAELANTGLTALCARSGLRTLHVMENGLGNSGLEALAASPTMSSLRELRCRYDRIGSPALIAIARSPHMRNLERLQLSQCSLDDNGIKALALSKHVALDYLNIGTNSSVGSKGITHLGTSTACRDLRTLVIDGTYLGDEGLEYIATVTHWPKLERLSLQHNQLTDTGLTALLRWPQLRNLRTLEIGTNEITDSGLERLVNTPDLRLERIEVWQSPCAANARAIVDASPLRGIAIDSTLTYGDYPAWVD